MNNSDFFIIWNTIFYCDNITNIHFQKIKFDESNPFSIEQLSLFKNLKHLKLENYSNVSFSINKIKKDNFNNLNHIFLFKNENLLQKFVNTLFRYSNTNIMKLQLFDEIENYILLTINEYYTNLINFSCSMNDNNYNSILSIIERSMYLNKLKIVIYEINNITPNNILIKISECFLKTLRSFRFNVFMKSIIIFI